MIDTTLSHFKITAKLGEGGMGEVYRAEDTKLGREVAIKVLPGAVADDPERLARFQREAKVLASLNHPNIAAIYSLEVGGGLAPTDDNVGEGLAPSREGTSPSPTDAAMGSMPSPSLLSMSPTLTAQMTQEGVILGTAAYMSPEQARGKPVDRRTDNWAFGTLLWEMLTGERCFAGETVTDLLSSITRDDPDLERLPAETPPRIKELIARCTRKDVSQRLQHIGDGRVLLEEVAAGDTGLDLATPSDSVTGQSATAAAVSAGSGRLGWIVAAVLAVVAGILGMTHLQSRGFEPPPLQHFNVSINPPDGVRLIPGGSLAGPPVLSPDGQQIAYSGREEAGKQSIYVRRLDQPEARKLEGTEGAHRLFWSPDSRSIGFFTDGFMRRVPSDGGLVVNLADSPDGRGGTWGKDGTILFAPNYIGGFFRISEDGGPATQVTQLGELPDQHTHRYPQLLPDGEHFLYLVRGRTAGGAETDISGIHLGSLQKGEIRKVLDDVSNVLYAQGHLLFVREGALMAQPFDLERLELEGETRILVHNVRFDRRFSRGVFSAAENGLLIYQQGEGLSRAELRWFDREGNDLGTVGEPDYYVDPRVAPDNRRIAFRTADPAAGSTLWIQNLETGFRTRFSSPQTDAYSPVWSPDGGQIAFGMRAGGRRGLYVKATVGGTPEELLLEGGFTPLSWSPDGRVLLARSEIETGVGGNLWAVPVDQISEPIMIAQDLQQLRSGRFSPDGRWILYVSAEAQTGLYVRVEPFPTTDSKWQISTGQAVEPVWKPEGDGIIFSSFEGTIMQADVRASEGRFEVLGIRELFSADLAQLEGNRLEIAPDGRLLISVPRDLDIDHSITLETGWASRLSE